MTRLIAAWRSIPTAKPNWGLHAMMLRRNVQVITDVCIVSVVGYCML